MHCHIACIDEKTHGCYISAKMKKSYKYKIYLKAMGARSVSPEQLTLEDDLDVLKKLNDKITKSHFVGKVVLLALDGVIDKAGLDIDRRYTQVHIPNSYILNATKMYKTFIYGASINPNRIDALDRLEQAKKDGAVLVKWIPSVMHINPNDPKFIPFYEKMRSLKLMLLSHTSTEKTFTSAIDSYSDPLKLELPLSLGVTVVAAHSAAKGKSQGGQNFSRFISLAEIYPNLFGDISALTQINRFHSLQMVLSKKVLKGRLIYGTDWPLHFFPLVSPNYFTHVIGIKGVYRVSKYANVWDRDVMLKKELGTPEEVFLNGDKLIKDPYFWDTTIK